MKPKLLWTDPGLPPRGEDKVKATVYSMAFRPDGTQMVVAVANLVLVYSTADGDLVHRLRGHKDTVYCVAYSRDGLRFASGGADKTVIIWNSKGEGILKFTHNESIQSVAYNPSAEILASCTGTDFGLWSKEQKSVTKHKVFAKILCSKWNNDGQYLALGCYNGQILIRQKNGEEYKVIEKSSPVWCMAWSPPRRDDPSDVLAVGCWNQTLSFYQALSGTQYLKERRVHFYPCSIDYFSSGDFMVVGGSDKRASLCTREAVRLCTVCELEEWVWSLSVRPQPGLLTTPGVAVGSQGGSITMWDLDFAAVYAIESERFAVREHMTDVVVHHMRAEKRVRIKSRDYVQNLAINKDCLAIQLPDRINVYELHRRGEGEANNSVDMHYKLRKDRIYLKRSKAAEVKRSKAAKLATEAAKKALDDDKEVVDEQSKSFLGATARHVALAEGKKMQLYAFTADPVCVEREWVFDAEVTSLRVDGGPAGQEGIIVGLKDGSVLKVYVDNPFPVDMVKTTSAVKHACFSKNRDQLAVVNDQKTLQVWSGMMSRNNAPPAAASTASFAAASAVTGLPVFSCENVSAVAFNDEYVDMLIYSKDEEQYLRVGNHPPQQHNIKGTVVGLVGSKLFLQVQGGAVTVVDLPLSSVLSSVIEAKEFDAAFKIACLGVTASDWRKLADAAAQNSDFLCARASYTRIHDLRSIELLHSMETRRNQVRATGDDSYLEKNRTGETLDQPSAKAAGSRRRAKEAPAAAAVKKKVASSSPLEPLFQAELLAHRGAYQEAAKVYTRAGHVKLAIDLFADLRQWEEAKLFAASSSDSGIDTRELVRRQAEWAEEVEDWSAAAEMYVSAGDALRAVKLLGEHQDDATWVDNLANLARRLDTVNHKEVLQTAAKFFLAAGEDEMAREIYEKLEDVDALISIYVRRQEWDLAIKLAEQQQESTNLFDQSLFLPYAEWLALHDRFDEALEAYRKSGRPDQAAKMMEQLTFNAVVESRFKDAAYYYWLLAAELLRSIKPVEGEESTREDALRAVLPKYQEYLLKADLYYAYHHVESYFLPFSEMRPEVLFQVARFMINSLGSRSEAPHGISRAKILYTLAKQSKQLGAFKLARFAYDKLQHMKVPEQWTDELDLDMLLVHAKPVRDNTELLPVCYRCGATNALLNPASSAAASSSPVQALHKHCDVCTSCGHPFVRSFLNFEILPLVEFLPEPGLTDEEARELIREPPPDNGTRGGLIGGNKRGGQWNERKMGEANVMNMDPEDEMGEADDDDLFGKAINRTLSTQEGINTYVSVTVDAKTLRSLNREEVFCCEPRAEGMRATFYKSALPECHLAISQSCHRFFHEEDLEFALLRDSVCPYSRVSATEVGDFGPC